MAAEETGSGQPPPRKTTAAEIDRLIALDAYRALSYIVDRHMDERDREASLTIVCGQCRKICVGCDEGGYGICDLCGESWCTCCMLRGEVDLEYCEECERLCCAHCDRYDDASAACAHAAPSSAPRNDLPHDTADQLDATIAADHDAALKHIVGCHSDNLEPLYCCPAYCVRCRKIRVIDGVDRYIETCCDICGDLWCGECCRESGSAPPQSRCEHCGQCRCERCRSAHLASAECEILSE